MTNQPTCKERINDRLKTHLSIFETLQKMINGIEPDDMTETDIKNIKYLGYKLSDYENDNINPYQIINEYGLSLELDTIRPAYEEYIIKWCLSWGGPADYFYFTVSKGPIYYEVDKIVYQFQDWYDSAEINLCADDFALLEDILNILADVDDFINSELEKLS